MKRFITLLLAVMMCSMFAVPAFAYDSPTGGGGSSSSTNYYTVTVNYYDKETGAKIAESYVTELIREGRSYDVTAYDAIDIEGYTYDSTTGDPTTGFMNDNKVVDVWYVADEPVEPVPPVDPESPVEPEPPVEPESPVEPEPPVETGSTTPTSPQTGYEVGITAFIVVAVLCGAVAVISTKKAFSHRA